MAKQSGGMPKIDEDFMKELISQGVPAKRESQPDDAPQPGSETETAHEGRQTETVQVEKPTPRKRKGGSGDYRETYFQKVELADRQPLYVSRTTHEKLMRIVTVIGGRKVTVSSYVENILLRHFEQYQDEINTLYESHFQKACLTMVIYCILTGLLVYYIALWLWYRYTDSRTSPGRTDDAPLPRNGVSGYTLIGESRYKGGLIGTAQDKSGHLPQAVENDTIFAPQADGQPEETPGYENDEPDYEDEEIAGYMDGDDDTGRGYGRELLTNWAKRYARRTPTTPPKRRNGKAAGTLASIEGTNLYDAVVENINGGLAKVAELLGRNEAELATAAVLPKLAIQAKGTRSVRHERLPII